MLKNATSTRDVKSSKSSMITRPICSNPKLITNPHVLDFIFKNKVYFMNGRLCEWKGRRSNYDRLRYILSPKRVFGEGVTPDDDVLSQYYAINMLDGQLIPIYIYVACGKCDNCVMSKRFSFVERCRLESQMHDSFPWFVTLTYNPEHIHKKAVEFFNSDGSSELKLIPSLSVRDVQLYLKRLRINLERKFDGKYDKPIRYAACGEYGKKGRPHYHLIIWGLPSFNHTDYINISKIIRDSWQKGFISTRLIDPSIDKVFKYTTKYLCKPRGKDNTCNLLQDKPFLNSSRKNGGIGRPYLEGSKVYIHRSLDTRLKYFDKFSQSAKDIKFNSWSLNVLFPSFKRIVPSYIRRAVVEREYFRSIEPHYCPYHERDFDWYSDVFRQFTYIPDFSQGSILHDLKYTDVADCDYVLNKWLTKHSLFTPGDLHDYLANAVHNDVERDSFFFGLFSEGKEINLSERAYLSRLDQERSLSLEVL